MDAFRLTVVSWITALAPGCGGAVTESPAAPGTLFVADYGANAILRYDAADGAFLGVFAAGAAQRVDRPANLRLGPEGQLYAAGFGRGDIVRYDVRSGAMRDVFYRDTTLLEEPVDLLFHGDDLVVLGNDTRNAVVIAPDGEVMQAFGSPTMRAAQDFLIDADGALLVATESHPELGSAIQVWDLAAGALVRHFGGRDDLAVASGLALGPDGLLYVADLERDRVVRFDPRTGAPLGAFVTDALRAPVKLELGPDGALYVLDAAGLHRFDPDTGAYHETIVTVGDGHLVRPLGFHFVTEAALRDLP